MMHQTKPFRVFLFFLNFRSVFFLYLFDLVFSHYFLPYFLSPIISIFLSSFLFLHFHFIFLGLQKLQSKPITHFHPCLSFYVFCNYFYRRVELIAILFTLTFRRRLFKQHNNINTIQTVELLRLDRIPRKVLET